MYKKSPISTLKAKLFINFDLKTKNKSQISDIFVPFTPSNPKKCTKHRQFRLKNLKKTQISDIFVPFTPSNPKNVQKIANFHLVSKTFHQFRPSNKK